MNRKYRKCREQKPEHFQDLIKVTTYPFKAFRKPQAEQIENHTKAQSIKTVKNQRH